ncbi:MAG TPA: type II secretion system protein [Thermoanaerobaculia bacterium]|nr:type II secretion system protein [Thermoanaerobaculia bacterium]
MTPGQQRGFTLAELLTVTTIICVLAAAALPVARTGIRRQKEIELRMALRRIHEAIDRYHDLRVRGMIRDPPHLGQGEYPRSLDELVEGVEVMPAGTRVRFLRRRDLIDPMTGRAEWRTLSDTDDPGTLTTDGNNVFEVHSTSTAGALDGKSRYSEW